MNYSKIAPVYQFLSRLVFGRTLVEAQLNALSKSDLEGKLLILGGGDGEILKYLDFFKGKVTFLEVSGKMLELAQKKAKREVNFIHKNFFDFEPTTKFDVILLPFLVDNFTDAEMTFTAQKLHSFLNSDGEVWVVDYTESPNFWQKSLLSAMYMFFKIVADIKVNKLPAVEQIMLDNGFKKTEEMLFYRKFIEAKRYLLA